MRSRLLSMFLCATLISCYAAPITVSDTAPYLSVSHRLNMLCTTLYGPQHPLTDYIASFRQLIAQYGHLAKSSPDKESPELIQLRTTLDSIKNYAVNMLKKYQLISGATPLPLASAPLPAQFLNPSNTDPLPIAPVPGLTPEQQNLATQQYIHAMQTLSPAHYQGTIGQQPATREELHEDQISLLITGVIIIGICTAIGWYVLSKSIRELKNMRQDQAAFSINAARRRLDLEIERGAR